jgi:hypothetical protein
MTDAYPCLPYPSVAHNWLAQATMENNSKAAGGRVRTGQIDRGGKCTLRTSGYDQAL